MASFLIDASLPRPTAPLVRSLGHAATDVRDIGLGDAPDDQIAAHAQAHRLILLTKDHDFGDLADYPPDQHHGIAVIEAPEQAGRAPVLALVAELVRDQNTLDLLPGRLAIVQPGRIRLRPPP